MTGYISTKSALAAAAMAVGLGMGATQAANHAVAAEGSVIELTQTACQFVESENGVDHGYTTSKKADCEAINGDSGAERLASSKTITLKPGKHTFRVTNKNVPYELGFWLRGDGILARATLPSVSGGGLVQGATKDYVIELTPGEYVYSCPLNPTLDYKLVVEG